MGSSPAIFIVAYLAFAMPALISGSSSKWSLSTCSLEVVTLLSGCMYRNGSGPGYPITRCLLLELLRIYQQAGERGHPIDCWGSRRPHVDSDPAIGERKPAAIAANAGEPRIHSPEQPGEW